MRVEFQGIAVTGLSYYVITWSIKKKGPVFTSAFDPLLVVFSFSVDICIGKFCIFGQVRLYSIVMY